MDRRAGLDRRVVDGLAHPTRSSLRSDLDRAVERDELAAHYQPLIDLRTGQLQGFEALVRWRHPDRGLIAPAEFIDLAERTGSIHGIGAWVLDRACRQAQVWRASRPALRMAVNVSARQLERPGLVDLVANALDRSGLDAAALTLEITESITLQDIDGVTVQLDQLKRLGIGLAIDDFGTGFSSLTYLRRFPVDQLKIDRSFVLEVTRSPADRAIVASVIDLAHALGIDAVAEGVETEDQLAELTALGCDLGQGFRWRHPQDPAAVDRWLSL